jgi:hypothetical protein
MKRRRMLQTLAAVPAAGLLRAQQPVVPPKPSPAAVEQIPVIEATIPDLAGPTVAQFFSPEQFECLRRLSDVIYPAANGIPGALQTGTPEFLDFLLGESPEKRKKLYRDGLDELNHRSKKSVGVSFSEANKEQADQLLTPLREPWAVDPDPFTAFLRAARLDIIQATESSHDWVRVVSKRVRGAGGLGMYWFPID